MELSLDRGPQFSTSATGSATSPGSIPLSHRYLRVLIVLALYGVAVLAIHELAAEFRTHAVPTAIDTGMCHRR